MNVQDLKFESHPSGVDGVRAVVEFDNGYGASIVSGPYFYTNEERPFEIAVLADGNITYKTAITDDVLDELTADEANKVLKEIQELPPLNRLEKLN